jgi:hypothetical protein
MRTLRHILHPPDQADIRLAKLDKLRSVNQSLQARPADPVDRDSGHIDPNPRFQTDMAGPVESITRCLHGIAEYNLIHLTRLDPGTLHSSPGRYRPQIVGYDLSQRSAKFPERSPRAVYYYDIFNPVLL